MAKAAVKLSMEQLENAIEKLSPEQKQEMARKLWAMRIERLSEKMRKAAKKNKMTQKDVDRMCEEARQEIYERRYQSGH